jgi:hypothetical protein
VHELSDVLSGLSKDSEPGLPDLREVNRVTFQPPIDLSVSYDGPAKVQQFRQGGVIGAHGSQRPNVRLHRQEEASEAPLSTVRCKASFGHMITLCGSGVPRTREALHPCATASLLLWT